MKPSSSLLGASRLPLTPKRGNKDFYKGTRQSYVPGGGHRTGPPGKHVVQGKAKYRLIDERVRYFVGPGAAALESTQLKPYVSVLTSRPTPPSLPSFSPQPTRPESGFTPQTFSRFSKRYAALGPEERAALIMEARRGWWAGMQKEFGDSVTREAEESRTQEVERLAAGH
ncbi:hypothetical protein JCM24511_04706 [Saitozyma sp. JCM 24511]|nr:hypothetical protein JCM24511_04706 [Saitozyma sp. JCM 24511]